MFVWNKREDQYIQDINQLNNNNYGILTTFLHFSTVMVVAMDLTSVQRSIMDCKV